MGNSQVQEALARQLHAIHREAMGDVSGSPFEWEQTSIQAREAWIQVAQFVEATDEERCINRYKGLPMVATVATINEPMATEQDPIVRVEHVQVNKRFVDYEGIVHERLRDFYNPDHK